MDISNIANHLELALLCDEIDLPSELKTHVLDFYMTLEINTFQNNFDQLFQEKTSKSAAQDIHNACMDDPAGIKELTIYLIAALYTKEVYNQKGISYEIFIDTFKIFSRFTKEHFRSHGFYGFDRGWWTYRVFSLTLYRIGQLEYEMVSLNEIIPERGNLGDPVISIHIPSDAKLDSKEVASSLFKAKEFFKERYKFKFMYCYSWLLSPVLSSMLSTTSNILSFQSYFEEIYYNEEDDNFMEWVYKKKYTDLSLLPEKTTLERNIKNHLLSGGKIGCAYGILMH